MSPYQTSCSYGFDECVPLFQGVCFPFDFFHKYLTYFDLSPDSLHLQLFRFSSLNFCKMDLPINVISSSCMIATSENVDALCKEYGFHPDDGVLIPLDEASILEPPLGKVGDFVKSFYANYRLVRTNFLDEVLCRNGVKIYKLTPNAETRL